MPLGILKVFQEMRRGNYDEDQLDKRGFMNSFHGGLTKSVPKPWQVYPAGVLFGLGFDTATEVGLLVLAGGAAAFSLSTSKARRSAVSWTRRPITQSARAAAGSSSLLPRTSLEPWSFSPTAADSELMAIQADLPHHLQRLRPTAGGR